jgi:hypothetical protein
MMSTRRPVLAALVASTALVLAAAPALAGPPFICHAFELSGHQSLPWGVRHDAGWKNPDPAYDVAALNADVTRLLAGTMPISARMETLRRATIYASKDRGVAESLLKTLEARAKAEPGNALALFDAGFLTEAYRQASRVYEWDMLAGREKTEWTFKTPPAADGAKLINAAVALNTAEAPAMRKALLMIH